MSNAEKPVVPTVRIDDADAPPALERARASNGVFGSPHLPVPIPQQSADDEPIERCAPGDIILATAWMIAWALTVFIVANVIASI